MRYITTISGIS